MGQLFTRAREVNQVINHVVTVFVGAKTVGGYSFFMFRRGNVNQGMRGASNGKTNKTNRQIMISYNWTDSKTIALKIRNELRREGLPVWFDEDEMKDNMFDRMAEGVKKSDVVLVFLSSNYEESDNCQMEACYAKILKKRLIPIHVQDGYIADNWLGLITAAILYHDFRKGQFQDNFKKLLNAICEDDTLQAIDNVPTIDEQCKILQEMLKEAARISSETDDSPLIDGKQTERVALEVVTGTNSQHLVHQSSHYHRREDFEKLYVTPKGDILLEDLLPRSLKQAEEEAKLRCHSDVSKNHYIQIYGNVVGIIGEAGIGKTTLSKMLTQKVLDDSLGQFKFDYVFYISVRYVNIKTKTTFLRFLVDNTSCDWFSKEWCKDIVNNLLMKLNSNPKVIFIFDGLDEVEISTSNFAKVSLDVEAEATPEDFMKSLLSGRLLPHAKKFITSRPSQLYDLHVAYRPHFIATILGLNREAQLDLCRQICGDDAADVLQFLEDHPDIFSYCYVPANCILTMAAFQNKDFTDPETKRSLVTMTGIMTYNVEEYTASLHVTLKTEILGEELEKLCKLAWEGILNSKLIFNKSDTSNVGIDAATLSAFMSTYLSTKLKSKLLPGAKRFYFSHLIWQEFFSAIHVMLFMSSDEFEKHLKRFSESKWQKVLQFMFGVHNTLTYSHLENIFVVSKQSNKKWNALKKITLELVPTWKVDDGKISNWKTNENAAKELFQLCVLVHEAQDKDLKNQIAAALPSDIVLRGYLLPSDVTSLYYVLSGRSTNLNMWLQVQFVEESFRILFDKMATSDCRYNIQMPKVYCNWQKIDDDSAKSLAACLSQIQRLSLWECELSASGVEYISSGISKLEKQMELLDLSCNRIGDKGAEYLSSCLKNITQLIIYYCKITDAGVHHLSTAISKLSRPMKLLHLSGNRIGDKGAEYLSSCLNNINQLNIDDCNITDAGVHHLSTAVSKLSRPMKLLYLRDNPIGDKGAEYLSSCLKNISQLNIEGCEITDTGVHHLSTAIPKLSRPMELLDLSCNRIGDKEAEYLSSCLKNINHFDIGLCEITDAGVHHLSTAISKLSRPMELLDLTWNGIGDKGAKYLSSCLKNINQLDIHECKITDAGVHYLSTAISKLSHPMELLNLGYNSIGDKGAEYLSSCLKNINQLHIGSCKITDAGVHHLSTAISKLSRPIKSLRLDSYGGMPWADQKNKIGLQGATALTSCLANIERLDIGSCGIPEEGIKLMKDAMTSFGYKTEIIGLDDQAPDMSGDKSK